MLIEPFYQYKLNGSTSPLGSSFASVAFQQTLDDARNVGKSIGGTLLTEASVPRYCSLIFQATAKESFAEVSGLVIQAIGSFTGNAFSRAIVEFDANLVEDKTEKTKIKVSECVGPIGLYAIGYTGYTTGSLTAKLSLEISSKKLIEENLIKPKTKIGLSSFLFLIDKLRNEINIKKINHVKLLQLVLDESGYSAMLKNKKDIENESKLENIKELLSAMKDFDGLESFLEHVALATSVDQDWDGEKINMMTMHGSKGLEFDVVFLPGWEEGLFPHQKSIQEKGQSGLEEERRLAYVGITRAKKKALISFAMNRFYQGNWIDSMASRFIDELPEKHLEKNSFFDETRDDDNDFEFNQDLEIDEGKRSPGWARYQKRIK